MSDSPAWTPELLRDPHHVADKRARVQKMFAAIAPSYDLNNRLHSLWLDQHWRRRAVELASVSYSDWIVDVACGTGDLTLKFADAIWRPDPLPEVGQVLGIDFTYQMLPLAREKSNKTLSTCEFFGDPLSYAVQFINADALSLPLPDASCDVLSIAFGIRNITDPLAALKEFRRVLRPNGRLIILEFSLPTNPLLRTLYNFYFRQILPRTATLISRDKTGAYKYLPESVNTFITPNQMTSLMTTAGFTTITQHPLTFGICICYRGFVPG
ncbi:MAG TPA: bifunctional demethylmenaquinone methyltransferase/2-methoxy-6-polyprenyl-1,4-benzoquinol methylase UbiE [Tepidisphaeraceae bacterium]|jgi:demethylmenaquinone methyltransferase/2-methoxy-6-polyprenyl-1,4-benzoquinol methylase|nr:bifunctional demethylmenaquinone methyltransferase/2-methoxy-6-polyprenyl-1,4-benzoquinol methylase UbiE [Tepidisphaeraceae bacterium]